MSAARLQSLKTCCTSIRHLRRGCR